MDLTWTAELPARRTGAVLGAGLVRAALAALGAPPAAVGEASHLVHAAASHLLAQAPRGPHHHILVAVRGADCTIAVSDGPLGCAAVLEPGHARLRPAVPPADLREAPGTGCGQLDVHRADGGGTLIRLRLSLRTQTRGVLPGALAHAPLTRLPGPAS